MRKPAPGTYRAVVTGTDRGTFKLVFTTVTGGQQTVIQTVDESIAAGQTRKFEMRYAGEGQATVDEVSSFTPDVRAGYDLAGQPL